MTAFRVRMMLLAIAVGALLGQLCTGPANAAVDNSPSINVCMALRYGTTLAELERALEARGYTAYDAGTYAGMSVRLHCPALIPNVLGMLA